MKNKYSRFFVHRILAVVAVAFATAVNALAQTNGTLPVVSIHASDSSASESGDPGRFVLFRDGPTNQALNVFCLIDGTASNGVDYAEIPHWIPVPAGVREVGIPVNPIDDNVVEGTETVNLHLVYSPTMPPINYLIGLSSNATVFILDNDPPPTNQPPTIHIASPATGQTFSAPADILVLAGVEDPDGKAAAATVEFFVGDHKIGDGQLTDPGPLHAQAFRFYWTNVPAGEYNLTGKVTDEQGLSARSDTVHVIVTTNPPPNQPPRVAIATPTNGQTFFTKVVCPPCVTNNPPCDVPCYLQGADITICAAAEDPDGYVATVEFFAGDHSLGIRTNLCPLCAGPVNPFCLVWSNVPAGDYVLRAKATDNLGASALSEPIQIHVVSQSPPPLPLVTLWATDPNATEPCPTANTPPPQVDTGRFVVRRDRGTNVPFVVYYSISGTASNGVDYAALSGSVEIPAGRFEAEIIINPLPDPLVEGQESVVLHLRPVACVAIFPPPPDCYAIGTPAEAAVVIRDCEHITNLPPRVVITTPTNGAVFLAPVNIPIACDTVDMDGYVWRVEFFANDHKIGEDSKLFLIAPPDGSHIGYDMVWSNPPPGLYALRAKAFDAAGASAFSEPVRISVIGTNPPPPTNFPPIVTISAPDPIAAEGTNCWRWYTNMIGWNDPGRTNFSGTNTATFVVRRSGPTNASLTIPYEIRGSASNGVDYVELPGVVTIPAGERSARITVIPLDDALVECTETVILGLVVSSNSPPDYIVGWPGRAGAIIVDNDQPPPDTRLLCDGHFHLNIPAPNNFNYRLECSLDMIHWVPVDSGAVTEFGIRFVEPDTTDFPNRFYRVVPETAPPPME